MVTGSGTTCFLFLLPSTPANPVNISPNVLFPPSFCMGLCVAKQVICERKLIVHYAHALKNPPANNKRARGKSFYRSTYLAAGRELHIRTGYRPLAQRQI